MVGERERERGAEERRDIEEEAERFSEAGEGIM